MQPEAPKIEFPCDYPIKVVGVAATDYEQTMLDVIRVHAPELDASRAKSKLSSNGKYCAITIFIEATGTDQLEAIFKDLKATGRVQMVL